MRGALSKELRIRAGDPRRIEFRATDPAGDTAEGVVSGYLSTFWHVDSYGTAVHPDAFTESLKRRADRLPLLFNHDPFAAVGKLDNIEVDETGLRHESEVIDDGADGTVLLKRMRGGVPFAHSFGFRTLRERAATDDDPLIVPDDAPEWMIRNLPHSVYVIEEVKLYEGSVVTFPANENDTIASVKSDIEAHAVASLTEALRSGRATAAQRGLAASLAAALGGDTGARSAPVVDEQAKADRDAAFRMWAENVGLPELVGL